MSRPYYLIFLVALLAGCSGNQTPETVDSAINDTQPGIKEAVSANLALADALDGDTDRTIKNCYVCSLGMSGKPELSVEVQGYTAHLCSEHCQKHFTEHWQSVVEATEIPERESQ